MTRRIPVAALAALALAGAAVPATAGSAVQRLDVRANVKMLPGGGATTLQEGTFTGAPLGGGRVRVRTTVGQGRGSTMIFVLSNRRGSVSGRGDVAVNFKGSLILYKGTATITRGTGAYRSMRARHLRVSGHGEISSETFLVALAGRVSS
jgi:hypothetical protein